MKRLKKWIGLVLSISLVLALQPVRSFADSSRSLSQPSADSSLIRCANEGAINANEGAINANEGAGDTAMTFKPGHIQTDTSDIEAPKKKTSSGLKKAGETEALPAVYSSVTAGRAPAAAKNQGNYGTCWAFAMTTVAETTYHANAEASSSEITPLSILQEAYFAYSVGKDPLENSSSDEMTYYLAEGEDSILDFGGIDEWTMISVSQWDNGATSATLPYAEPYFSQAAAGTLSDDYNYKYDVAHVKDVNLLSTASMTLSERNAALKEMLYEYGALVFSFGYHTKIEDPEDPGKTIPVNYVNGTYGSYYCSSEQYANHSVVLVGWNDNYPKENFGDTKTDLPEGNGAWLVQNSWGAYGNSTCGDAEKTGEVAAEDRQGYIWISYYDKSIDSIFTVYDFESAEKYQHNYMYDGTLSTAAKTVEEKGTSIGAYYEIKGLTSDLEKVDAINFMTYSADLTVELTVIENTTTEDPLGDNGQKKYTKKYTAKYPGLHTIEIDGPVLSKGQGFTVLLKLPDGGTFYVDSYVEKEQECLTCDPDFENDYTFSLSPDGNTLIWAKDYDYTYRIKGFTNDVVYYAATEARIEGTDISPVLLQGGGIASNLEGTTLTAPEAPAGYTFRGWFTGYTSENNGTIISEEETFVLGWEELKGDTTCTAVYAVNSEATLDLTVTAGAFKASVGGAAAEAYTESETLSLKPGAALTLIYTDTTDRFLYWADENGNLLGKEMTLNLNPVKAASVHAVTVGNNSSGSTAFSLVIFRTAEGGIVYTAFLGNAEDFSLPALPEGASSWSMTKLKIRAAMAEQRIITVTAVPST